MRFGIIIQARTGSKRLPHKVIRKIGGYTILEILIKRLKRKLSKTPIIIATTTKANDDIIERISKKNNVFVFRGSEYDVLDRYFQAAKQFDLKVISRVTSDNPFTLPEMIVHQKCCLLKKHLDYVSSPEMITGLGNEVFTFNALKKSWLLSKQLYEREHVTPYIYAHHREFRLEFIDPPRRYRNQNIRLTIDTNLDLQLFRIIYKKMGNMININIDSVINLLKSDDDLRKLNSGVIQKEIMKN